jgi:hypothetical protein
MGCTFLGCILSSLCSIAWQLEASVENELEHFAADGQQRQRLSKLSSTQAAIMLLSKWYSHALHLCLWAHQHAASNLGAIEYGRREWHVHQDLTVAFYMDISSAMRSRSLNATK